MSDMPFERTLESPPFSFCGIDLFGPFLVKERRSLVKRWGVMYTCLSSRSTHIESVISLDTNSFILCLRRFICRRGSIRMLRSDNGTNFVCAQSELKELFKNLDHNKLKLFSEMNLMLITLFGKETPLIVVILVVSRNAR